MSSIQQVVLAAIFGMGYLTLTSLVGAKVLSWAGRGAMLAELRDSLAVVVGVVVHACLVALLLFVRPDAIKYLAWAFVIIMLIDWRGSIADARSLSRNLSATSIYGLVCFAIAVGFHHGAGHGDNLFWSIYKLTSVTPGDAPQGLMQAQFLLYGDQLQRLENFSIFDRPFLGGLVSLGALLPIGKMAGTVFNSYADPENYFYVALWVWLNSAVLIAIVSMLKWCEGRYARIVAYFIVLASPCVVFNVIGAWPKLFAVYVIFCSGLLMLRGYWLLGVILSGVSFLIHGSFLWAHLSLCGVLFLYAIVESRKGAKTFGRAFAVLLLAAIYPALWFMAERFSGGESPLRLYYMYGVPVSYGLHHSVDEIARGFYSSTSPERLMALPFMSLLKSLSPLEILQWLCSFSYVGGDFSWRGFANSLFYTQVNRPIFGFCLTAGAIALFGFAKNYSRDWRLTLSVCVFLLLPLIPGMGLYRRDDHFILGIMLFAVIPLIIALAAGLQSMSRQGLIVVVLLVTSEYAAVYASRYPSVRFFNEHLEYYLWVALGVLLISAVGVLSYLLKVPRESIVVPRVEGTHG